MLYINLILGLLFLIILGRYFYSLYSEGFYRPESWASAVKAGKVSRELYREFRRYRDKIRFFAWWLQVERIRKDKAEGCFAELGVYKGESARILHLMDPQRTFHLFDTFEGFSKTDLSGETGEAAGYTEKNFADTSLEKVREYLGESRRLVFHPGLFPGTASGLANERYVLVNIDADLYQPTRAGLEYFYPRLVPGGVIFVHDYNHKWEGCRRAVDEFLRGIPEAPVLLPDQDGTLIIRKNKQHEPDKSR
ncbi:MAG TPA: TylF/MycF/NovP-related O-methyltransferase [Bacteroidales bacterium]|nr:TylF/MycF/NovP-related O-methyltransferase [Bacteroidales bacterium]HSA42092.1 TylF/MycF/NovP-related O-methyltransferase [Bacteroidales bacterium]